ncbi:MAG: Fur family transcriptional regulator [Jatrophihabitans sp.]|uniref:Fur family transcriptional regulator n=1 Tax=Jatrophihabitans sp. TaxID=1932789 RepID=UPI003F80F117
MTELSAALHARGLRMTPQRQGVLDAVRSMGHATPEQIADAVADVDVATVYRTLELLEELGLVRHTHLGHGAATYRPADDDHIHVVCHACGRRIDQPATLVDDLADTLLQREGFVIDRAHLTLFGRCRDCAAGATPAAPVTREQTGHHRH